MDYKKEIQKRGLKFVWVADQIEVNRSTFIVYLNHPSLMTKEIEDKIKAFLNGRG